MGTLAFASSGFLPSPVDKMVIGAQALCFSLASLLVPKGGATYASAITGLLLSVLRANFFPFSLLFSTLYGLLIDGSFYFLKVRSAGYVESTKVVVLLTIVTGSNLCRVNFTK